MPYIKLTDRNKFETPIKQVLTVLTGPESDYTKGEYFGYFVNRLVRRFMMIQEGVEVSFNSTFFDDTKRKTLQVGADSMAALINRSDPINSAGDLNYVITATLWGFMGASAKFPQARYGMRAYLKGILEAIMHELKAPPGGNQSDITQAHRRNLITRGVLSDVIDETYRRDTVVYEQGKLSENGDIWAGGELFLEDKAE